MFSHYTKRITLTDIALLQNMSDNLLLRKLRLYILHNIVLFLSKKKKKNYKEVVTINAGKNITFD